MTKNNRFKETMLVLIVSYVNEDEHYTLDLENLEIVDLYTDERLGINQLIEGMLEDSSYIESLVDKAWGQSRWLNNFKDNHSPHYVASDEK